MYQCDQCGDRFWLAAGLLLHRKKNGYNPSIPVYMQCAMKRDIENTEELLKRAVAAIKAAETV
jgi:hypothetical protein